MAVKSEPAASAPTLPETAPPTDAVGQTLALLQPWIDYVPRQQRRLGVFIVLALLLHLVAFLFIRIDTTRSELRHPPRIHVTIENAHPAVEAEGSDAFWDRLTDPRLFLLPINPAADLSSGEAPLDLNEMNPQLGSSQLPAPVSLRDYSLSHTTSTSLAQQVQAAMVPPRQPFSYDETAPVVASATAWQWDAVLAGRHPSGMPPLPSPVSETDLSPTELRVAVDADGTVAHVMLEETCQKPELDQLAILAARKVRFQPTDRAGLAWGRLTVFWHDTAPPREIVVPTPPTPKED